MGLSCAQVQYLFIQNRKADIERDMTECTNQKRLLAMEQTDLSSRYQSMLKNKQLAYYANSQYHQVTYGYLMGYGKNITSFLSGTKTLKSDNSVVLTDYKGAVVLNHDYADVITSVLGSSAMDEAGRGGTFSVDKIPEMLEKLTGGFFSTQDFQDAINNKKIDGSFASNSVNALTGETTGSGETGSGKSKNAKIESIINFYYPIFQAAAANGWTTEYNKDISRNTDYVSDALTSGTFQLATVEDDGNYDVDTSLSYYTTNGFLQERTDSETREEITAWYNAEKARISLKEDDIDLDMNSLSTELESINTEMQSLKSLIDDAINSIFDWGKA